MGCSRRALGGPVHWRIRQQTEPGIVPRPGAAVMARKSPAGVYERARVLHRRRTRDGELVRLTVLWLSGPYEGKRGSLYVPLDDWPPMVRPAA